MQRTALRSLLVGVFGLLVFVPAFFAEAGSDPDPVHAGTAADPFVLYNSETVKLVFDNTYGAVQIIKAEAEITLVGGAVVKTVVLSGASNFPKANPTFVVPLYTEALPLANGTYTMRARVTDLNNNTSLWCAPIYVSKQWVVLQPPGGCAIFR